MTGFELTGRRVWVAGHRGMAGSALVRRLAREKCDIVTVPHSELDLLRQADVEAWMAAQKPDVVILAAAKVGGIMANVASPAEFLYNNLIIETNVIHGAWRCGVQKLLFLASSCIYPRLTTQPMTEDAMLTGALEPTNEGYALAKIAGIKMCAFYRRQYGCDYIAAVPSNLYGLNDNFDPQLSHVVPGMIRRAHDAKMGKTPIMQVWGSGNPRRELMHVDDAADACCFLLKNYAGEAPVNVGTGTDVSIRELAVLVAEIVGYTGAIEFDASKPDGMPVKRVDVARLQSLGWKASIDLRAGLAETYRWFLSQPDLCEA
jgi:GDP-L-fucose synthase